MSHTPQQLYVEAMGILVKYGLDQYTTGFDGELVHLLFQNHIDKVRAADSYDQTMKMIEEAMAGHLKIGVSLKVQDFIWNDNDCKKLYDIYTRWRSLLLAPMPGKAISLPIDVPHFPAGVERVL
jgi:hypothetical protein